MEKLLVTIVVIQYPYHQMEVSSPLGLTATMQMEILLGMFVYIKTTTGSWSQIGQDIDGESEGDWSGQSVSLSADGSTIAIGAERNDDNGHDSGHVRLF